MAICVVLLTGAGLMIRSFATLQSVNPGFRPDHVLTLQITLPETRYPDFKMALFYKQLLERLQTLPGVKYAAIARRVPLSGGTDLSLNFTIENRPVEISANQPRAQYRAVSADYFDTLGIPVVRGRHFNRTDAENTPGVVLINETMARVFFAGENPLGKRIKAGDSDHWSTIVGIVSDVKHSGLDAANKPETYYQYLQVPPDWMSFIEGTMTAVLRTTADPNSLVAAVRGEVQKMDSGLAVFNVHTMQALVDGSSRSPASAPCCWALLPASR